MAFGPARASELIPNSAGKFVCPKAMSTEGEGVFSKKRKSNKLRILRGLVPMPECN